MRAQTLAKHFIKQIVRKSCYRDFSINFRSKIVWLFFSFLRCLSNHFEHRKLGWNDWTLLLVVRCKIKRYLTVSIYIKKKKKRIYSFTFHHKLLFERNLFSFHCGYSSIEPCDQQTHTHTQTVVIFIHCCIHDFFAFLHENLHLTAIIPCGKMCWIRLWKQFLRKFFFITIAHVVPFIWNSSA